ncbi:uncharacterized protein LOC107868359 isoform X1 [Capsicum annuum]|uniref:uncharacterized protein LOC107868359 isoform X1 n=1 Tax=Capsicum annuum TaxID=4072 RepID=UPI001FB09677|nr:uncharacterized protein LOC107868359 isoform X1 [Capsicum annuum]
MKNVEFDLIDYSFNNVSKSFTSGVWGGQSVRKPLTNYTRYLPPPKNNGCQAEQRKEEVRKMPEQVILSEVRRMVEEMQALNKKLEDTEMAINEYFKPLDQQAEEVVKMQLKGDEKRKDELIEAMQRQAILEMAQAEKQKNMRMLNTNKHVQEKASTETLNQKKDNFVEN